MRADWVGVSRDGLAAACEADDAVATWRWDIPANLLHVDDRMVALFGLPPGAAGAGRAAALFLERIHPEDLAMVRARIARACAEGTSYVLAYRIRPDGAAERRVLSCGRCEHDAAGRPARGQGVIVDMTDTAAVVEPPLERAAAHGLAVREAVDALGDPFLRRLADMLLLEIGRNLARLPRGGGPARGRPRRFIV
ncbi:hypothetical protein OPKNFCMD_0242 [Methylobacterium crusticola]|uniref:PAS fold-3 domain-containing protein n=1 Tax=Methylobacterium crusticola TaxID=1697972 RepID=A0ABQ4QQN1_9HYPH|nr:PAS domain-containing protein [Methylobacterium crusticola]GJD47534.1 hypothetical protein OPKNFCMD_0242 [Methylobacterium crusticola]